MGFFSNAFVGFIAGICAIAGLQYYQRKRSKARMQRAVDLAALSRANAEDFRRLFSKEIFPSWIQFPEFERVNWLNAQLKEIWPKVSKAASAIISESLEPVLETYRPPGISLLTFKKFTLGTIAPQFGGVKVVDSPPNEIVMEFDVKWGGNPSIILDVQTVLGLSLPVQVKDVSFFGIFRVTLTPLVDTIPCFGAMTVALSQKPDMNFTLKIVGGDISSVPGLSAIIDGLIRTAVRDSLLWPARHVIPIVPGDYSYLELHKIGEIEVKLVEARDLLNVEILLGKPDAFSILHVREIPDEVRKSKTKNGTLNPIWNEVFYIPVHDLDHQKLKLSIYHETDISQSRLIGQAAYPLNELQPGILRYVWLNLVKDVDDPRADKEGKPRGKVHLEVTFRPKEDEDGGRSVLEKEMGLSMGSRSDVDLVATQRVLGQQKGSLKRGILMVTVDRAMDLIPRGLGQLADPYVVLRTQLGESRKRTKVVPKTLNPVWNETFDLLIDQAANDMLMIEVWDHDIFGKQSMGKAAVTLSRVIFVGEYQDELQLRDVDGGRIVIYLKWKPLT